MMGQSDIPCPVTGENDWELLVDGVADLEYSAPGDYCWLRSPRSGLIRIDPMPTAEILNLAYPPHYHAYVPPSRVSLNDSFKRLEAEVPKQWRLGSRRGARS